MDTTQSNIDSSVANNIESIKHIWLVFQRKPFARAISFCWFL